MLTTRNSPAHPRVTDDLTDLGFRARLEQADSRLILAMTLTSIPLYRPFRFSLCKTRFTCSTRRRLWPVGQLRTLAELG